jgi:hypothetical protein
MRPSSLLAPALCLCLCLCLGLGASCGGRPAGTAADDAGGNLEPDGGASPDTRVAPDRGAAKTDGAAPGPLCASDKECGTGELCLHDGTCIITGAVAGHCTKKPISCPMTAEDDAPVCGCDGKTYANRCNAHKAGVSAATEGVCLAPSCSALNAAYQAAILKAKACCTTCASAQCGTKVLGALQCGCMTYINVSPPAVLDAIQKQWTAFGCELGVYCPAVDCSAAGSSCAVVSSGGAGVCMDWSGDI